MEQTPNYYAVIPANVRYAKELCPNAKLLYGEITALSNSLGYCYAGNRYFAELYNISRLQTISDWVKSLERAGFITVEITYKGKEIDKRIIKIAHCIPTTENSYTCNGKTLEVQRKNVVGTTEKRCVNNTINNTSNNSSNTSNDVLEQTRANFFENEFADFCSTHQLPNLSKSVVFQNFFLEKEKSCAKKEKYGEAAYIATLQSIEAYISESSKYLSNKKDFGRIFDNFAISPEVVSLGNAFKAAYFERYGVNHASIRKSEETPAKAILAALRAQLKLSDKQEVPPAQIKAFFTATLGLSTYNNPMQAKVAFIASSFSQIIAALKAAKDGKSTSAGETFRERDKRLQQQQREDMDAKMRAAALYEAQKAQLERFLDNGYTITKEMKQYPAYKEMFGGQDFGAQDFGSEEAF